MPQQMKHPSGDVKVVPDELVAKYAERGWKKTTAKTAAAPVRKPRKRTAKKTSSTASTSTKK